MLWNFLSILDTIFIGYFILSEFVLDFMLNFDYILILLLILFSDITFLFLFYLFTFVFIIMQNVLEGFRILDTCQGKLQKVLEHVTCHVMS